MSSPEEELEVVDCESAGAVVTVTAELTHLCPFRDEEDEGTITISWEVLSCTIELHSLRRYLDLFDEAVISHEELTSHITGELSRLGGLRILSVASSWETAGAQVEVSFSCST